MKIVLKGLNREVYTHKVFANPIHPDGRMIDGKWEPPNGSGEPLVFNSAFGATCTFRGLSLSGDYRGEIEFDRDELVSWLTQFIIEQPEDALRLLSEMKTEALIYMSSLTRDETD
jgi:hypothetical protein